MKKYIFVLLVLFSGIVFAQIPDSLVTKLHRVAFTSGFTGADSLVTYGTTHYSDSVRYVDFKYGYNQIYITVTDSGSTFTDSLELRKGRPRMDDNGVVIDTIWDTSPLPVKDNEFENVTVLVGGGVTKTYTLLDWSIGLLRVVRTNAVRTADNVTRILFEAIKK